MKKFVYILFLIFNFIICVKDDPLEQPVVREFILKFDKNSNSDVHYITISYNHPETGEAQIHNGSILLTRRGNSKTVTVFQEIADRGIYLTRIQAKKLDKKENPRSFYTFEAPSIEQGIKIIFPPSYTQIPVYKICLGRKKCDTSEYSLKPIELKNKFKDKIEKAILTCNNCNDIKLGSNKLNSEFKKKFQSDA